MSPAYTAPASKVLTVLHIKDPYAPAFRYPEASDGATRCGLPLLAAELWVPVEGLPDVPVCRGCRGISDEEMTLC